MPEQHHHRSSLTQTNKKFKSRHSTKSALKDGAKGKIQRESPKSRPSTNAAAQSRLNRRNNAKQHQLQKRQSLVSSTRIFSGADGAPRIVAVVPLTTDVTAHEIVVKLINSLGDETAAEGCPQTGVWKFRADRFKTSLQFMLLPYGNIYAALDAAKAADYILFCLSPTFEVTNRGDTLLRTLQAQGMPSVVSIIRADDSIDAKSRQGIQKSLLSFIQYFIPAQKRIFDLHTPSDRLNALRALAEGAPADVRWREGRSWVLAEDVQWNEGTLSVTGVVRGSQLSPNRLIHLPNYGDYQISKIMSAPIPRPHRPNAAVMELEPTVIAEPDASSADSLVSSNDPDDMANEQTWPTEEEMTGHGTANGNGQDELIPDVNVEKKKSKRRIPKGMSEYQASWIVENGDDDDDDGASGEEDEDGDMRGEGEWVTEEEDEEEIEDGPPPAEDDVEMSESRNGVTFEDLDNEEETKQLETWRNRKREEEEDLAFPDELDTPQDVPARTRFQRYRGLRSFRTSPWDPYENLPRDYARIFQFEDFKRTERNVRRRAEEEIGAVQPGTRVTVFLKDVPQESSQTDLASPFVIFALLQHEHKKTVLNFTVQRNTEYEGSVRSKDPLILCVGPRRLHVNPIYSQHTRGGGKGVNNVHKFERYLRHGATYVATIYGPVMFGKEPCTLLRETEGLQAPELVAMGTFLNPDTTRIVAKRIILTGHPFKVHKKTATIRYMFFDPEDVMYYKPIQLYTKHGRTGHIRESLGTHGYFKAHFDGPINQMDTVCMSLYKRTYPKWSSLFSIHHPRPGELTEEGGIEGEKGLPIMSAVNSSRGQDAEGDSDMMEE